MKAIILAFSVAAAVAMADVGFSHQTHRTNPLSQYSLPVARPHPQYSAPAPQFSDAPAQYNFQWDVNDRYSGNYYGHQEQRNGPTTQGRYYVRLPDTRLMRVDYYADNHGFHPSVTFEGEAQYPRAQTQSYQAIPAFSQTLVRSVHAPSQAHAQAPSQGHVHSTYTSTQPNKQSIHGHVQPTHETSQDYQLPTLSYYQPRK
ncbi:cuticle protein 18.6-like [Macrobrachium nipponense]|uniref:cuticle protein 18.6-like n=1 Tax=Macrobrachium nipponense TaxID=159736 RepID=UPI0030C805E9